MTIRDRKELKKTAKRRLASAAYKPRRLVLIHSGISLLAVLLLAVIQYVITWQIDEKAGGLASLNTRSALETAQIVVQLAYVVLTPFWTMGIFHAILRLARGKSAYPHVLLEGFRRRRPVLRLVLMECLIYSIIVVAAMYGAWFLYTFTPDGQAFMEAMMKLIEMYGMSDYAQLAEAIPMEVIEQVSRVYLPILGVILAGLMIPAAYRMRLAPYVLMDKETVGAWKAIRMSGKLTRRNCGHLLLLDLGYWWYYLLPVVLTVPAYADVILALLGINLPVDPAILYMGGQLVHVLLSLLFECLANPRVQTTYALAYDVLREQYLQANPPQEKENRYGI